MLWRAQRNRWSTRKASRQRWFEREEMRLRSDVKGLGIVGGGTGNAAADDKIREWMPHVLKA